MADVKVRFGEYKAKDRLVEISDDFDITITRIGEDTYVPLGIPSFDGNAENNLLPYEVEIIGNAIDNMRLEILRDGNRIFNNDYNNEPYPVGKHTINWDGFDSNGEYDSTVFTSGTLQYKITGFLNGKQKTSESEEFNCEYNEVNWVDVKININTKIVDVTLRVNFTDGGAQGIKCFERDIDPDPKFRVAVTQCPWDDIPDAVLKSSGEKPIKKRTKTFESLKSLALKGLEYHWGRNHNHSVAKKLKINGEEFEVFIHAVNDVNNSMSSPEITYITNKKPGRSRNWELSRILFYNTGFLKYTNGWFFENEIHSVEDYKETAAHEIGHEILKYYGGHTYSKEHKGSTTLFTQSVLSSQPNHPVKGEIDLMKYFQNSIGYSYKKNIAATEKDTSGLIWLSKLVIS